MIVKIFSLFKILFFIIPIVLIYIICFIITYRIYINYMKQRKHACEKNMYYNFPILTQLNFIYIKNIKIELLKIIVLFASTVGLITLLRILNFGKTYNLWGLFMYKIKDAPNLIIISMIIVIMYFCIKMSNNLLKDTFYKIHLYYYNNNFYSKYMTSFWFKGNTNFLIVTKIYLYMNTIFTKKNNDSDTTLLIYLRETIKINANLRSLLSKVYKYSSVTYNLGQIEECFYYYLPHILLFSILLYDLSNYQIKYFYFAIFIFFLIKLYRRFKLFISQLDFHEIDKIISNYFYQTDIHSQMISAKNYNKRLRLVGSNGYAFDVHNNYVNQFKEYFKRGYVVDYIDIDFKKSYEPYNMRMLYIGFFILYYIFCYNVSIINCIVISMPLFASIILYEYCFYFYKKENAYLIKYMLLYISFLAISIIIVIWIYLTRHTLYFMNDNIWSYKITIEQSFTINEKLLFLKEYFSYKTKSFHINEKIKLLKILQAIPYYDLLQFSTIAEIKDYIDNLIETYEKVEDKLYPLLKDSVNMHNLYKEPVSIFDNFMKYIKETIKFMIRNKRK